MRHGKVLFGMGEGEDAVPGAGRGKGSGKGLRVECIDGIFIGQPGPVLPECPGRPMDADPEIAAHPGRIRPPIAVDPAVHNDLPPETFSVIQYNGLKRKVKSRFHINIPQSLPAASAKEFFHSALKKPNWMLYYYPFKIS
jgi:hypothetical protein